jgi:hypothetical protein
METILNLLLGLIAALENAESAATAWKGAAQTPF